VPKLVDEDEHAEDKNKRKDAGHYWPLMRGPAAAADRR
jgi:hypothetical protein